MKFRLPLICNKSVLLVFETFVAALIFKVQDYSNNPLINWPQNVLAGASKFFVIRKIHLCINYEALFTTFVVIHPLANDLNNLRSC